MTHPLAGLAVVLVVLGGLLGGLTLYRRLAAPHPEVLRKLLHVGMGLVTLSFPWLFTAFWPVGVLAGLSLALLVSLRLLAPLRASVGQVVSGVERFSLGEFYFPLAVAVLWGLYLHDLPDPPDRRLLLYVIPLLLLTLADALAALVGVRYGQIHYDTPETPKSLEGSVAFFLCSLLCILVPLLLGSDRGRVETLLIAVLLAWLATLFEAVAWAGLDNLVLPLVTHLLLAIYWELPASALMERLVVTAVVFTAVLAWKRWTTLIGSAVLGAFLVGYLCWALGGWPWIVPPGLVLVWYTWLFPQNGAHSTRRHNVHAVLCVSSAGLGWLFLSRLQERPEYYYPFTVSFAAHLAMIGLARLRRDRPTMASTSLLLVCVLKGSLLLAAYVAIQGGTARSLIEACLAVPVLGLAATGFWLTQPHRDDCPPDAPRWLRQAAWAALASLAAFFPFLGH